VRLWILVAEAPLMNLPLYGPALEPRDQDRGSIQARCAGGPAQADLAVSLVATIRTNEIALDDLHRHQHSLTYPDRAISRPAPRFRSP
jgi:hypothetical protein